LTPWIVFGERRPKKFAMRLADPEKRGLPVVRGEDDDDA
jgi:hypothetical protein